MREKLVVFIVIVALILLVAWLCPVASGLAAVFAGVLVWTFFPIIALVAIVYIICKR